MFQPGENVLEAVGERDGRTLTDRIAVFYQTESWGAPAKLELAQEPASQGRGTVHVTERDARDIRCLDASQRVRFGHAGDGRLIDSPGTRCGARVVELVNGRAQIDVLLNGGRCVVSFQAGGLPTAWITLEGPSAP